ncbi:MAG: hypothetical protein ACO3BO_03195, partial [Anaerohalosphaeraceae bacterium]
MGEKNSAIFAGHFQDRISVTIRAERARSSYLTISVNHFLKGKYNEVSNLAIEITCFVCLPGDQSGCR